jgi:hypothetical protein
MSSNFIYYLPILLLSFSISYIGYYAGLLNNRYLPQGESMAKRKTPALSPEAQAVNAAGEAGREKERKARRDNAEKQRRFRESMKALGFKQVLLWTLPCPADVQERMTAAGFRQAPAWETEKPRQEKKRNDPGRVKIAAAIRESSLGAADKSPEVRAALSRAAGEFLNTLGGSPGGKLSPEAQAVYRDFVELIRPLGDPWA